MTKPLTGRVALVTGGSRGIGHALCLALAREGAHVVATGRTVGGLEELDDAIKAVGGTATLVPLEMRDTDGIVRLGAALNERYGKLDIMVGNAGLAGSNSPLDHFQPKEWDEVVAVNFTANWHLIRVLHALLLKSDAGRVVFMTSNQPSRPRAYRGLYGASKTALESLARTYALETASTPIRVNLFNPGPTRTRMRAAVMPGEDPNTLPTPEAVANKIVPLCSPAFNETGKLFDFYADKLLSFRAPA
jgi:NAD(P)-dependent dehydrogenase (short-subunit alcohol dehydrogenase family)